MCNSICPLSAILTFCRHEKISDFSVTKEQQDRVMYQQKVDFAHLRSELQSIERQEMVALHSQVEQLFSDVERLKTSFRDQLNNSTSEARLQLNIDRLNHYDETASQDLKLRELSAEIDTEMSNFRTQLASFKTQTLQWVFGIVTGYVFTVEIKLSNFYFLTIFA